jgi:hypothetical protein
MRIFLLALPLLTSGCLAKTAVDIVTLPVRAASAGVDAVTTSQSEADQRRGRQIREAEEREGRIARRCERNPDRDECRGRAARRDEDDSPRP